MILNINEELKNSPTVAGKKFSRGDTINLDGYCSPYLFSTRPTCKCNKKYWTENDLGKECHVCEAIVYQNTSMGRGELLDGFQLLNPTIYEMVNRSKSFFKNNRRIDENGNSLEEDNAFFSFVKLQEIEDSQDKIDYLLIHIKEMNTKNKDDLIKLIEKIRIDDPESLFTKYIPVIHLKYRRDDTGSIGEINKYYGALLQTVDTLNNSNVITAETIDLIMLGLHKQLSKINVYLSDLNLLRNEFNPILSMSSRLPVLPQDIKEDFRGITISYQSFLRIYKYTILRILRQEFDMSIKDALEAHSKFKFIDDLLHKVVKIVKRDAVILINRVPSLTPRSIFAVKLNDICDSYTVQVTRLVFGYMGMDNDGDTVALIPLFTEEAKLNAMNNLSIEASIGDIFDYDERNLSSNMSKFYIGNYAMDLLENEYKEELNLE